MRTFCSYHLLRRIDGFRWTAASPLPGIFPKSSNMCVLTKGEMSVGECAQNSGPWISQFSHGIVTCVLDGRKPGQIARCPGRKDVGTRFVVPGSRHARTEDPDLECRHDAFKIAASSPGTPSPNSSAKRSSPLSSSSPFVRSAARCSMARLTFQEEFQMLKDVCLGRDVDLHLAAAPFSPRRISCPRISRNARSITSCPSRFPASSISLASSPESFLLLLLFTLLMSAVFCLVLWLREQSVLVANASSNLRDAASEELTAALKRSHRRNLQRQPDARHPYHFREVRSCSLR